MSRRKRLLSQSARRVPMSTELPSGEVLTAGMLTLFKNSSNVMRGGCRADKKTQASATYPRKAVMNFIIDRVQIAGGKCDAPLEMASIVICSRNYRRLLRVRDSLEIRAASFESVSSYHLYPRCSSCAATRIRLNV